MKSRQARTKKVLGLTFGFIGRNIDLFFDVNVAAFAPESRAFGGAIRI